MPLDTYVAAEILATCNALGSVVRGVYRRSSDCLNCLKDLILYLRRDDDEHSVLRQLGELKLVQTDLLPILKCSSDNKVIFDMCLRLLVILTHPAFLLYQEEIPEDKLTLNIYLSIVSHLQSYKRAFVDTDVWKVLADNLKVLMNQSYVDRDEDDRLTVERILIIVRNILHVPADDGDEKRTDDDTSLHDQVLWSLHLASLEDVILYFAANEDEHQYCLHVLEIVSLMFSQKSPEMLASADKPRSATEIEKDGKKLNTVRERECHSKSEREKKLLSQRFSGVYCVKNLKSISDRDHISHKLLTNMDTMKFDSDRAVKRTPKNRLPVADVKNYRHSTASMCQFLKQFCTIFINNCYNTMMVSVKRTLANKKMEDHDDTYYLWAMSYFMEFNRRVGFDLAVVSETISVQSFHYVQTQIDNYSDMMMAEKKKVKFWSRRMHLGLKAYKELLETLRMMGNSSHEHVKKCADVIETNVFYVIEYRELLFGLISSYDEIKFPFSYLVDLVKTIYLFFKMLEKYVKVHSKLIIQKKQRQKTTKKQKKNKPNHARNKDEPTETQSFQQKWDEVISSELSATLQGRKPIPEDVIPFDATSETSFEEQKVDATYKIHNALIGDKCGEAIAMLRAARELWPDNDVFGSSEIEPEDEFMILREIYFANLPQKSSSLPESVAENVDEEEIDDPEEDEETEAAAHSSVAEQHLDINDFFKKFASPKVVQPCCKLLAQYKTNSESTNVAVLKLMHRIAWEHKMFALFFQARVFITFQKILQDPEVNRNPITKELSRFCKFIVGKFVETAGKNRKVFVEMLFWKGPREAFEIEEGYDTYKKKPIAGLWTEEEETELKELYEQYSTSDNIDGNIVDAIREVLEKERSNREITLKLKGLGLIESAKQLKKPKKSTKKSSKAQENSLEMLENQFIEVPENLDQEQDNTSSDDDLEGFYSENRKSSSQHNSLAEIDPEIRETVEQSGSAEKDRNAPYAQVEMASDDTEDSLIETVTDAAETFPLDGSVKMVLDVTKNGFIETVTDAAETFPIDDSVEMALDTSEAAPRDVHVEMALDSEIYPSDGVAEIASDCAGTVSQDGRGGIISDEETSSQAADHAAMILDNS